MGNTSCRCKKANCEANSRYFIITVDDGSQEAKNLHLYPLQIDVNSFLAGNPSKILSSSSPSPPPPYQPNNENNKNDDNNDNNDNDDANNNVNNNNNNDNDNNENVDNNIEEKSADDYFLKNENVKINNSDRENKKEPSKNINSDNNNPEKNNNVNENIEKKNLTLDVNKEIIVEKNSDNIIINNNDLNNQNNNINDNNNNNNNNNDNDNKETKGNEKEEKVKRTTVIFQIYHCQSHISSREEIVHIKVIATDGNNRGSGHLRYEREGLKGIREMVASAVPHAELGSWYHWQILSPISSVPIPLNDLSSETPIRLFNVSDQTFLSYYDDHHGGNNNNINDSFVHFGNQGVPVTFFLKPLHLHFLSSN